jgi:DNA-binding MarR family transcriptional regulator
MTTTEPAATAATTPPPFSPPLTGVVIGQTERAIRAVLDALLTEANTTFTAWVGLRSLAITDPPPRPEAFVAELSHGLRIEPTEAQAALDDLVASGLVVSAAAAPLALTSSGHERYDQIATRLATVTVRLYGDLPPADLETTARVLSIVATRADAVLAG